MRARKILILVLFMFSSGAFDTLPRADSGSLNFAGIELPEHPSFGAVSDGCTLSKNPKSSRPAAGEERGAAMGGPHQQTLKLPLRHRSSAGDGVTKLSIVNSTARDLTRIQTLHRRILEKKNHNAAASPESNGASSPTEAAPPDGAPGQLMATLESGVSLGSGEYFMDVFVGTPPRHFSLILDTGSDLNWLQCDPCHDCFEQSGPHYDPKASLSFRNITCHDPRCRLVSPPEPPPPCGPENQTCPYFYWYGDSSNTTGDLALERFTVNLTNPAGELEFRRVENVMFGCGHWNRGLFHGAAGLLGLGRGPLSFSSQLQSLYGHSFSYCLVDRNSNASVSSKLIFGEDRSFRSRPGANFTTLLRKQSQVETFYYVQIKSILVGGEAVRIPEETAAAAAGTIIDSGTTLSYFAEPSYGLIREALVRTVKGYPLVKDFPVLSPCYNVTGSASPELPAFGIEFGDGAVWNFPAENYFIRLESEGIVCLAILGTPRASLSIIGNYQQQNFHIQYDTKRSRLGFAPKNCADL